MAYSVELIVDALQKLTSDFDYNNGKPNKNFQYKYFLTLLYFLNNSPKCEKGLSQAIQNGLKITTINPENGNTLLMDLASEKFAINPKIDTTPIIQALIQNGIEINKKNSMNNNTAIMLSVHNHEQLKCLVANNANISIKNNDNKTAADIAFEKHWIFIKNMSKGSFVENEFFKNYCYLKHLEKRNN